MAYIGRGLDKISNVEVLDNITFDGSSSYTLQKNSVNFIPSSANTLLISIDGIVQAGNFTVSGSTIDFGTAVAGTSTCNFVLHYGVGLITAPSDGTVTTAKLGANSVTAAKLNNDIISGSTELASEPADTDEFLVSDAGTLKRIDYSLIKGGGKILQVVSGNHTSQASTTSSSYVDVSSNLNVSITPSATSSKILIMAHFNECYHNSTTNGMGHFLQVTAAGSEIIRAHAVYFADIGGEEMVNQDLIFIHSPSTTSAVEYKMRFKSQVSGQTVVINQNSAPGGSSLILMEIGA